MPTDVATSALAGKRSTINRQFKKDERIEKLGDFADYMTYNLWPVPYIMPWSTMTNVYKFLQFFYILGLMFYFDNFSTTPFVYLAMHGSYGFFWVIKDRTFPDPYM